jgi:predicted CXXCH cytochrome family protein
MLLQPQQQRPVLQASCSRCHNRAATWSHAQLLKQCQGAELCRQKHCAVISVAVADAVQHSSTACEQVQGSTAETTVVLSMQLVNTGIIGSHV